MQNLLFGSKTAFDVLLFLFVNEVSFASEMKVCLKTALAPIQNALQRLEKAEILESYFEKNRKMYAFCSDCVYRWEIEAIVKKAYTQLSSDEKKRYCLVHKRRAGSVLQPSGNARKILTQFWNRLIAVSELDLIHRSKKEASTVVRRGKASIHIEMPNSRTLIFKEKGAWYVGLSLETCFTNSFLWSLDLNSELITLSHLRHGKEVPVFLFHLAVKKQGCIESVDAHLCTNDTYLGSISWDAKSIHFQWRVIGPQKNEEMLYVYR